MRLTQSRPAAVKGAWALNTADFQYSEWFVSASPAYVGFGFVRSISEYSHAAFLSLFVWGLCAICP